MRKINLEYKVKEIGLNTFKEVLKVESELKVDTDGNTYTKMDKLAGQQQQKKSKLMRVQERSYGYPIQKRI